MAKTVTKYRYRNRTKKKNGTRRGRMTLPLTVILGFTPLIAKGVMEVKANGWGVGLGNTVPALIPYNPNTAKMDFSQLHWGFWPIIGGVLVHKLAGYLGINRMLSRMNVPLLRV
jgi:hypothetical protein